MGCDIHMHVERYGYAEWDKDKKHIGWQPVQWRIKDCWMCNGTGVRGEDAFGNECKPEVAGEPCTWCNRPLDVYDRYELQHHAGVEPGRTREQWLNDRNYNRFAMLANVRNGAGFAGIKTGEGFEYIAEPRGLPEDVHYQIQDLSDEYGIDGHSHSWCTVSELLIFLNRTREPGMLCGYVTPYEYTQWKTEGSPNGWCGDTSGKKVSNATMEAMIASGEADPKNDDFFGQVYTFVEWPITYKDAFGREGIAQLEELKSLYPDGPTRLVFWFDN